VPLVSSFSKNLLAFYHRRKKMSGEQYIENVKKIENILFASQNYRSDSASLEI